MKFVILLCVLSALLLQIEASPLKLQPRESRAVSRQQQAANEVAPAVAPASDDDEDDDDEDDDDDEPDLGDLVDDDDDDDEEDDDDDEEDDTPQGQAAPAAGGAAASSDDDEEEDDDDDDDYLDRLFDDILGDDDDEDDDDEASSPVVQQSPAAAASPAQPLDEIAPISASSAAAGISDGVDLPAESGNAVESAAVSGNVADDIGSGSAVAAAGNAANQAASAGNNEGDLKNNVIDMSTDGFQARHNHFIDAIFSRINRIVATNYDPFVVRLAGRNAAGAAYGSGTSNKAHKTSYGSNQKQTGNKKLKNTKSEPRAANGASKQEGQTVAESKLQEQLMQLQTEQQQSIKAIELKQQQQEQLQQQQQQQQKQEAKQETAEVRTVFGSEEATAVKSSSVSKKTQAVSSSTTNKHNTKKAAAHGNGGGKIKANGGNYNQPASGKDVVEKLQKAEGSLSGLASLKRVGNVKVVSDAEGRNSTIKAKFTLGPLILRVEKSFKRGSVRSVKSATARTNEMVGRIKFSVVDDRATLMSIKVQQPKQVEVESKDNHDRTREFVWRRTPKIAKLVNEKLKLAAESLFTPQGVEVVRL